MGRVGVQLLATPPSQVVVPAIVLYELDVGIAKSTAPQKRQAQLAELLRVVRVLPFDNQAAFASAQIRAKLEATGVPIGPLDTLIAGSALAVGATLVSHNLREFSRVPGLQVVDWY